MWSATAHRIGRAPMSFVRIPLIVLICGTNTSARKYAATPCRCSTPPEPPFAAFPSTALPLPTIENVLCHCLQLRVLPGKQTLQPTLSLSLCIPLLPLALNHVYFAHTNCQRTLFMAHRNQRQTCQISVCSAIMECAALSRLTAPNSPAQL